MGHCSRSVCFSWTNFFFPAIFILKLCLSFALWWCSAMSSVWVTTFLFYTSIQSSLGGNLKLAWFSQLKIILSQGEKIMFWSQINISSAESWISCCSFVYFYSLSKEEERLSAFDFYLFMILFSLQCWFLLEHIGYVTVIWFDTLIALEGWLSNEVIN